jgi:hypothetical protein
VRRSLVLLALAASTYSLQVLLPTTAAGDPVIAAAGDIAHGGQPNRPQRRTARLVMSIEPAAALTLGDNQYPDGELADFEAAYDRRGGASSTSHDRSRATTTITRREPTGTSTTSVDGPAAATAGTTASTSAPGISSP